MPALFIHPVRFGQQKATTARRENFDWSADILVG
jgi:hypothetical protein